MRLRIWLGIAAVAVSSPAASAAMVITADRGGAIEHYARRYAMIRDSGAQVIVDGPCLSACTLLLGLVPPERVCVTANASFGFHAAWFPDMAGGRVVSAAHTRRLHDLYPPYIRSWIARRGGLSVGMIFLRGRELRALLPACRTAGPARAAGPPGGHFATGHGLEISSISNGLGGRL